MIQAAIIKYLARFLSVNTIFETDRADHAGNMRIGEKTFKRTDSRTKRGMPKLDSLLGKWGRRLLYRGVHYQRLR